MSTSRTAIESLMPAFFFDAVESEGKLKFVKRGGASVATIPHDDAMLGKDGKPAIGETRGKETEIPYQVTIKFPDIDRDHEVNTLYDRRLTGNSLAVTTLDLNVDMDADKGAQVAEVNLFNAWWSRQLASMSVSFKQLHIEPTDVITFTKTGMPDQTMRVTKRDIGASGEIQIEMVRDEPSVYTSTATGTSGSYTPQTIYAPRPSALYVLDITLLRDQDDGYGYYMAANGYWQTDWKGCVVYRSLDDGETYSEIETFVDPVTAGSTSTTLGDFSGGNVFDESNVVRVTLMTGTLSSLTESQVLAGGNVAIIGDEVIQFRTATLVSAGVYDLSGLLRGRRGTEFAMGGHRVSESFILASTSTWSREKLQSADVGRTVWLKPVTFGMTSQDAPEQSMTFAATCLEPYSPVLPGVGRDASGNITIKWIRRTRVGGAWIDSVDASLGEDSEAYEVDIYSSGTYVTLKRTISVTAETASYTAAQQTTDFGSTQSTIYFKVYQVSAQVGRGYALTAQG